jgi:hypothetical protein
MIVDNWAPFITTQLHIAGALTGLLFVGLSLNLKKILSFPALPKRALLALAVLLMVLIVCSLILIPGQPSRLVGIEVLVLGLVMLVVGTRMEIRMLRGPGLKGRSTYLANFVLLEFGLVPYVVGGALLMAGDANGLHWIAAAIIISVVKAVLEAWVLLVEINR